MIKFSMVSVQKIISILSFFLSLIILSSFPRLQHPNATNHSMKYTLAVAVDESSKLDFILLNHFDILSFEVLHATGSWLIRPHLPL